MTIWVQQSMISCLKCYYHAKLLNESRIKFFQKSLALIPRCFTMHLLLYIYENQNFNEDLSMPLTQAQAK